MQTVTLTITITSPGCARYRLTDAQGKVVWRNRPIDCPEGHAGARERLVAWSLRHGYKVVERKDVRQKVGEAQAAGKELHVAPSRPCSPWEREQGI